jgi:hypothetical protein
MKYLFILRHFVRINNFFIRKKNNLFLKGEGIFKIKSFFPKKIAS